MRLTILGNNSALPAHGRHPTAQVLEIREQLFLIDCGEGTQEQMQRYNIRRKRINHIFISHLHGDHYFGLIGLLTSMSLGGRATELSVYGPPQLKDIIDLQLKVADVKLSYPLRFIPIEAGIAGTLLDTPYITVHCFPVEHRIPCSGFVFESRIPGRKLLPEKCKELGIPAAFYSRLKNGEDYMRRDGLLISNEQVTESPAPSKRYAYCADTLYTTSFLSHIKEVDMLYHEATYLHQLAERARERYHSTAVEAALLAREAGVQHLLIGHYSSKYEDISAFEREARTIFMNTTATCEGASYDI